MGLGREFLNFGPFEWHGFTYSNVNYEDCFSTTSLIFPEFYYKA